MPNFARRFAASLIASTSLAVVLACSGSSSAPSGPPQHTGQSCTVASQCYPGIDAGALLGQVTCLTQLTNGYCTHTCRTNADCCAVAGECSGGVKEVCASFESSGQLYCFVSCAAADIPPAADGGATDASTYCQTSANATFTCRSTGGGSANQKFCGP
jgi:hypothetical protein